MTRHDLADSILLIVCIAAGVFLAGVALHGAGLIP